MQLEFQLARALPRDAVHLPWDMEIIVTDGLSSTAVERHGLPLLEAVLAAFRALDLDLGPVVLVPNARVALSDPVGETLGARVAFIILGERPGLSAADSLGIYLTYNPRPGTTDAGRNCISNVRPPAGLGYEAVTTKLGYLASEALRRRISGVTFKESAEPASSPVLPASGCVG
jgi:ethanolamine ammonia-lyase small subunit